jgi:hypothetical protein
MKNTIMQVMRDAWRFLQRAGPYVLLEIVLPGGTLLALLLYLYRSGQLRGPADVGALAIGALRIASRLFDQLAFVWRPVGGVGGFAPGQAGPGASMPHLLLPGR